MSNKETIFWDETHTGKVQGGFYIRCDLFKQVKHFEDMGYKVVGIKPGDGWNMEFICEKPEDKEEVKDENS